jgi:hypothetical protein
MVDPQPGRRDLGRPGRQHLGQPVGAERLGVQHRDRRGSGARRLRRDPVRLHPLPRAVPQPAHAGAPEGAGRPHGSDRRFLDEARRRLHPLGVVVAADVFGLSPNDPRDINIGQQWEGVLAAADHVLPMVYPSHYFPTHLRGVPRPNRMPYETVFASVGMGWSASDGCATKACHRARDPVAAGVQRAMGRPRLHVRPGAGRGADPGRLRRGPRGLGLLAPGFALRTDLGSLRARDRAARRPSSSRCPPSCSRSTCSNGRACAERMAARQTSAAPRGN